MGDNLSSLSAIISGGSSSFEEFLDGLSLLISMVAFLGLMQIFILTVDNFVGKYCRGIRAGEFLDDD